MARDQVRWKKGHAPEDVIRDIEQFRSNFLDRLEVEMTVIKEAGVAIAKQYVPVDTGALRETIEGEVDKLAKAVIIRLKAGDNQVDYSVYPEFGTIHMDAQPYMRPAMQAIAPMVVKRVSDAWDDAWRSV